MKQVSAAISVANEIRTEHMENLSAVEGASSTSIVNTNLGNSAESYFLMECLKHSMMHTVMHSMMKPNLPW